MLVIVCLALSKESENFCYFWISTFPLLGIFLLFCHPRASIDCHPLVKPEYDKKSMSSSDKQSADPRIL